MKKKEIQTNEGVDSSVVLTPFFDGTDLEYWKIRMRTHLKAKGLWTIVANVFEEASTMVNLQQQR